MAEWRPNGRQGWRDRGSGVHRPASALAMLSITSSIREIHERKGNVFQKVTWECEQEADVHHNVEGVGGQVKHGYEKQYRLQRAELFSCPSVA